MSPDNSVDSLMTMRFKGFYIVRAQRVAALLLLVLCFAILAALYGLRKRAAWNVWGWK